MRKKYGSADAGKNVFTSDQKMNEKMKELGWLNPLLSVSFVGERLNLSCHTVCGHQIYGPGDIEGHLGSDGKHYCSVRGALAVLYS